jgi:hypothetical protein
MKNAMEQGIITLNAATAKSCNLRFRGTRMGTKLRADKSFHKLGNQRAYSICALSVSPISVIGVESESRRSRNIEAERVRELRPNVPGGGLLDFSGTVIVEILSAAIFMSTMRVLHFRNDECSGSQ